MTTPRTFPVLLDGYTDLPPGKIANVVTFLERTEPPANPPALRPDLAIRHVEQPTVAWFRALYRRIGERWLWLSAAVMPDHRLEAYITAPTVEILALTVMARTSASPRSTSARPAKPRSSRLALAGKRSAPAPPGI